MVYEVRLPLVPLEEAQCKQVEEHLNNLKQVNNNEHTINWIWCNESKVARLAEDKGHEIVGVIDRTSKSTPYSQYQHISECKEADVAIDFSNPELLFLY